MMKVPLVSIIIPVYNAADSIGTITNQILKQSFKDFELILVDDGSTDTTLQIIRGFASKDKRVVVRAQKNGGPSSARNTGLQKARGTYIQFYDADDAIVPGALKQLVATAEASGTDCLVSGWAIDLQTQTKLVRDYKTVSPQPATIQAPELIPYTIKSIGTDGTLYNLWNKLFRTDIIHKHNLRFDESIRFGEDLLFAFGFLKHAQKLTIVSNISYRYTANSQSSVFSTSSLNPAFRQANDDGLTAFVGDNPDHELSDLYHWVRWRWLLSYWTLIARSNLPRDKKLNLIKQIPNRPYVVASSAKYIGTRKRRLEKLGKQLLRSPRQALLVASSTAFAKEAIITVKQRLKR